MAALANRRLLLGEQTYYEEIGAELGRSGGTVHTQVAKIHERLDVGSRPRAVLKALRLGLLQLDEGSSAYLGRDRRG